MLNNKEIKIAVEWLMENRGYKLNQWIVDSFGYESLIHKALLRQDIDTIVNEIEQYDANTQMQLIDLIYN